MVPTQNGESTLPGTWSVAGALHMEDVRRSFRRWLDHPLVEGRKCPGATTERYEGSQARTGVKATDCDRLQRGTRQQ